MTIIPGIYKIQSKVKPEKFYIDSAIYIRNRWAMHLNDLKKNHHHASKLQNHYNKYGKDDLILIIVEPCLPEFLVIREQYYINKLKPFFNSSPTASSSLGIKRSDETKRKISESRRGITPWNKGLKGRKMSEEFKQGCAERMKGNQRNKGKHWKWTEDQKQNNLIGEKNPFFGKHHTKEGIEKIIKGQKLAKNKLSA